MKATSFNIKNERNLTMLVDFMNLLWEMVT